MKRLVFHLAICCAILPTFLDYSAHGEQPRTDELKASARALSRAFRLAAKDATPSVVTVYSFGQESAIRSQRQESDTAPNPQSPDPNNPIPDSPGPKPKSRTTDEGDSLPLTGLGSGVIVDATGLIITNNHVIANAKKVVVQLADETEIEATAVHGDPDSDIAIVRIEHEEPFAAAILGDSDLAEIGDWVLAIGSPFRLEATVSAGIISAKNRTIQRIRRGRLLQTDAAINPGNSGGPLVDLDGNVIAISTAIATRNGGYQGIGFAIPINSAKWIADELATHGKVRRAAMGIRLAELNPKVAKKLNLPVNLGVLVYQVIDKSAAAAAGIKPLDVILEFAGERVRKPSSLQEVVERKPVGSTQTVKVFRAGEEMMLDVELATLEDPTVESKEEEKEKTNTLEWNKPIEDTQPPKTKRSDRKDKTKKKEIKTKASKKKADKIDESNDTKVSSESPNEKEPVKP